MDNDVFQLGVVPEGSTQSDQPGEAMEAELPIGDRIQRQYIRKPGWCGFPTKKTEVTTLRSQQLALQHPGNVILQG